MATHTKMEVGPLGRTPEEWAQAVLPLGGRSFHGKSVFKWLHGRGITSPEEMTDLPKSLRAKLTEAGVGPVLEIVQERRALDDTRKLLVKMKDGATVETCSFLP